MKVDALTGKSSLRRMNEWKNFNIFKADTKMKKKESFHGEISKSIFLRKQRGGQSDKGEERCHRS